MFFDSLSDIEPVASRTGCSVFVLPSDASVSIKNSITISPEDGKRTISIDQVRDIMSTLLTKQTTDRYIIIRPAEALGEEAANAILKNLEEPQDKVHFVLITDSPSSLLPTILSRAAVYILCTKVNFDASINADAKVKDLAKRLLVARSADILPLAEELTKKKDGVRAHVLAVLSVAIEMLYKSYFKTGKIVFLQKLPKFLAAYSAIEKNGHIKLQIVANLV